jgi:Spy/CpxP family protein refolding chaperone
MEDSMVTRLRLTTTVFAIAAALAVPVMAQNAATTNMDILRQKVKADKKLVVAENLNLTDAEGAKFWPVYEAYQKDLQQINERLAATIKAYADAYNKGPVADDVAKKLLDDAAAIDDAELQLKKTAMPKILAALPAMKAARYIQIENKIRAAIRYELAANIPLVQ